MRTSLVWLLSLVASAQAAPSQEPREFSLPTLRERPPELFLPREITIGTSHGLAWAALRAVGVRLAYSFDSISADPRRRSWNYALPDGSTLILHAAASDLFPKDFYVTGIFVAHPKTGEADRKAEQVESFTLP